MEVVTSTTGTLLTTELGKFRMIKENKLDTKTNTFTSKTTVLGELNSCDISTYYLQVLSRIIHFRKSTTF